jgi:small subunit ribosomal protein S21
MRTWAVAHGPLFVSGSALSSERDRVEVTLSENDRLDFVLKKFRRQITKAGLFQDLKKKRFYESPSVRRRRKDKAAARRKVKRARRREQS